MGGRLRESFFFFVSVGGFDLTILVVQFTDRLQANVISTGLFGVLLLPILQRTAAMPDPVEGVNLKPHLTIVASDSTFTSTHHPPLPCPLLSAWRVLTDPVQCTTEPALPSITNPNPSRSSMIQRSLTGTTGTRRPSCLMCSSRVRSHSWPRSRQAV